MKKLTNKFIITFETTVDAIAMEELAKKKLLPGRLIPVPTQISAGCGMCWVAEPEEKEILVQAIQETDLLYQDFWDI